MRLFKTKLQLAKKRLHIVNAVPLAVNSTNVARIIKKGYIYDTDLHLFVNRNNPNKWVKIDDRSQTFQFIIKDRQGKTIHCSRITETV